MNTPHFYINPSGQLQEQDAMQKDRNLCHTARMVNERVAVDTLIQLTTKITPQERKAFALEKMQQWLEWYLKPQYDLPYESSELHHDVEQLMASQYLQDWWLNEWYNYDEVLAPDMVRTLASYRKVYQRKHLKGVALLMAQQRSAEDYFIYHSWRFDVEHRLFADLENSYAQAIVKV